MCESKVVYGECAKCGCEWVAIGEIIPGFSDHEDVNCPQCGEFMGNFRFDMGVTVKIVDKEERHGKKRQA